MKPILLGALTSLVFALVGCVTTAPVKQQHQFDQEALIKYDVKGTGRIIGEAFARTRGGDIKLAAGFPVYLMPATLYALERMKIMAEGREPEPFDPRFERYVRKTIANAQGRFGFRNLAPGHYVVYCKIKWEAGGYETGGYLLAQVNAADGKTVGPVILRMGRATN